jgi:hypothetical protein
MISRLGLVLGAGVLALLTAGPAAADDTVYNGMTKQALEQLLQANGKAASEVDGGLIRIEEGPLLMLAQCPANENGTCYELEVLRNFSNVRPTADVVNKWNYTTKVPEASVADDGSLHMEMWLTTIGITDKAVVDTITWFEGAWSSDDSLKFWGPYMTPGTGGNNMTSSSPTEGTAIGDPIGDAGLITPAQPK